MSHLLNISNMSHKMMYGPGFCDDSCDTGCYTMCHDTCRKGCGVTCRNHRS